MLLLMKILKKHIFDYFKTKDVYADYRKCGYSKKFLEEHRQEILLHKAAKNAFDELHLKKLPKVNKDLCIGCGSCEYHCPAKPKAIIITGLGEQTKLAAKEKTKK